MFKTFSVDNVLVLNLQFPNSVKITIKGYINQLYMIHQVISVPVVKSTIMTRS